ncbi:uncharacterized protein EI90DRAFT_3029384 [Cantharellus anzutake]|uniref:uncharacterized protein n=1 Tax=Cantharellus anzutake TaxID=1750568 RepID=UPI001903C2CC|nr:uncharacterized protein EI90DRAFT_3029384 [Cantharellus anzutake]KAF8342551.1 hypothetical protein EI90DRAFT_3029384 [Cantharellus anzutake]
MLAATEKFDSGKLCGTSLRNINGREPINEVGTLHSVISFPVSIERVGEPGRTTMSRMPSLQWPQSGRCIQGDANSLSST